MRGVRRPVRVLLVAVVALCVMPCAGCVTGDGGANRSGIEALWGRTVSTYLEDRLWVEGQAYDAGQHLMVPLHAAFDDRSGEWASQFVEHFSRCESDFDASLEAPLLERLHYQYLITRFLVLRSDTNSSAAMDARLTERVLADIRRTWTEQPAWQWDREDFASMRERVEWKLSRPDTGRSFHRALIDEELFVFAVAADLATLQRDSGAGVDPVLQDISHLAYRAFSEQGVFTQDGTWLLQPGVWWDHRDYGYAGNTQVDADLEKKPVPGIAADSSHAHRLPLFLTSLMRGAEVEAHAMAYEQMRSGLALQFGEHVLVAPSPTFRGYRTTNYLDGSNGVYRYGYVTQGEGSGYGPYELSGTLLLGWWGFTEDDSIREAYREQAELFPPGQIEIDTYVGPNTTRDRNPLVRLPGSLENGFLELCCTLAGER